MKCALLHRVFVQVTFAVSFRLLGGMCVIVAWLLSYTAAASTLRCDAGGLSVQSWTLWDRSACLGAIEYNDTVWAVTRNKHQNAQVHKWVASRHTVVASFDSPVRKLLFASDDSIIWTTDARTFCYARIDLGKIFDIVCIAHSYPSNNVMVNSTAGTICFADSTWRGPCCRISSRPE